MSMSSELYHIIKKMTSTKCQIGENYMFINKALNGRNNICGENIALFRKQMKISQRVLADKLQLSGLDIDKNAVQRIESGQRFITDIELLHFVKVLDCSFEDLYKIEPDISQDSSLRSE